MKKQLHLPIPRILELGFKGKNWTKEAPDKFEYTGRSYHLELGSNSEIYYNPEESSYIWYLTTTLGDLGNGLLLDIETETGLLVLLKTLGVSSNQPDDAKPNVTSNSSSEDMKGKNG